MHKLKINRKGIELYLLFIVVCFNYSNAGFSQEQNVLSIKGTGFELNGSPFEYTGISFFNAIFNPAFNKNSETRKEYLREFKVNGINVLRVWCQWNNTRGFVDGGPGKTLYNEYGTLKPDVASVLKSIVNDADSEGMVVLLVLFSRESWKENLRLTDEASDKAVEEVTKTFKSYRNLVFQIWNEFDYRSVNYLNIIRQYDPERLVTNSPGYAGFLGNDEEDRKLDFLSPHTTREDSRHWEVAPREIEYLMIKYRKPVVDDEPARKGTPNFGGPKSPTTPYDHILHIYNVWKVGGYAIYHHDMFQTGYGTEAVPENGIPLPGFSSYHDEVFNFLKNKERYLKQIRSEKTD